MIQAYFSQIRATITSYIDSSTSGICIAVAWFTHRDLFHAVLNALDRKVEVSIIIIDDIINRGPNGLDFALFLSKGGQIRFMNTRKMLMHNKFCLFDGKILITGSYNWTYSAEGRNVENIIATDEGSVCHDFSEQFWKLWEELPPIGQYTHVEFQDFQYEDIINCLDYLRDEYESMEQAQILKPFSVADVDKLKKDISITKLNTIISNISNTKRAKPVLKANISLEIANNRTLLIFERGQELPCTKNIRTSTARDDQVKVAGNILYGNDSEANRNEPLVKLHMDNLPKMKAGVVTFIIIVTIDTNGYMHIKVVCENTGVSKSVVYNAIDKITYQ